MLVCEVLECLCAVVCCAVLSCVELIARWWCTVSFVLFRGESWCVCIVLRWFGLFRVVLCCFGVVLCGFVPRCAGLCCCALCCAVCVLVCGVLCCFVLCWW